MTTETDTETCPCGGDHSTDGIRRLIVDCHAYPWHEPDPHGDYPECGPENLTRMAEEFGVLVKYLPDGPGPDGWGDWAWWYEIIGPAENIVRLLAAEYCGAEPEALELVECGSEPWDGVWTAA